MNPKCNPGNKACGGRCIPQDQDCLGALRRKAQGRFLGAVGLGAGGYAATKIGASKLAEGLSEPDTIGYASRELVDPVARKLKYKTIFKNRKELAQLKGGRKVLAGLAIGAASTPLAIGSIVQNFRAFNATAQANAEQYRKNKGRKDSVWATGFENELTETL